MSAPLEEDEEQDEDGEVQSVSSGDDTDTDDSLAALSEDERVIKQAEESPEDGPANPDNHDDDSLAGVENMSGEAEEPQGAMSDNGDIEGNDTGNASFDHLPNSTRTSSVNELEVCVEMEEESIASSHIPEVSDVKLEEEDEIELLDLSHSSGTLGEESIEGTRSTPTVKSEDNPPFNLFNAGHAHVRADSDARSNATRSPTLPQHYREAFRAIEEDLNSQEEERSLSQMRRFGEFSPTRFP